MANATSKVKPVVIDPNKATEDQIAKGLAMLAKEETKKKRIAAGELKGHSSKPYSEMTEEEKAKRQEYNTRRRIKQTMLIQKALDAGLSVTDKEVEKEMASRGL